ncbi:MAG: methylmalonyl-CoA epimerase [Chloroflexi bacterium]|nr:methylmalonyl-CoA epimerase [Chloroflexota bacterium]
MASHHVSPPDQGPPAGPAIHHIGIAVADTAAALRLYVGTLGLRPGPTELNERERVKITFLDGRSGRLELLEPTEPDSAVGRFLEKRGEGMHHLCLEVTDLEGELTRLATAGYQLVDQIPRRGMHGERLAFVHPKSTHGVMIELYEVVR